MTNQERAKLIAQKLSEIVQLAAEAPASAAAAGGNPFSGAGPSSEFLDLHLPASVATSEEVAHIVKEINAAATTGTLASINKVAGAVKGLVGGLKALFPLPV